MPVFETFAKRQKRLRGEAPDVYVYDQIPRPLRIQLVQIMYELLGHPNDVSDDYGDGPNVTHAYRAIVETLRKEMGVFHLPPTDREYRNYVANELAEFMLATEAAEDFLSAVELICRVIESTACRTNYRHRANAATDAKDAITEINARFREHGIGYEYDGELIRIDAELPHSEAVKPALSLLRNPEYKGAEEEFRQAYEDYRKGSYKSALNEALKALESTMKCICEKRGWAYAKTDTSAKLLKLCFDKGLIPPFWETHFSALRSTLETGVPTARNKLGGHGQGTEPTEVPDFLVGYVLHITASAIVFLVKAEQALLA